MDLLNTLRIAMRALHRNKLRSFLTGLGMIVGVSAVITLVSIGNGARTSIEARIAELGQNIMIIFPGSSRQSGARSGWGGRPTLKPDDALAIEGEINHVLGVSPEARSRSQIVGGGLNWNTNVLGESPDYTELRNWPLAAGAMFTWTDVERIAKVAVVGETIVNELFPEGEDPLGKVVRIGTAPFRIVGVLASKGFNVNGQDQDDLVIIPYTSHLRRVSRRDYVSSILVQVDDPEYFGAVEQQIDGLLSERHHVDEREGPDFTVRTQLEIVEQATATTKTMTMLLTGIACVSLLVGGIGIMNIMLVSVSERTREIGVRLAIGAHDRDVMRQFLLEAVILSLSGGGIGVVVGILASQLLGHLNGWPVDVSPESVVLALGFSAAVGIFFGFYPARSAARMDPIHALRFE